MDKVDAPIVPPENCESCGRDVSKFCIHGVGLGCGCVCAACAQAASTLEPSASLLTLLGIKKKAEVTELDPRADVSADTFEQAVHEAPAEAKAASPEQLAQAQTVVPEATPSPELYVAKPTSLKLSDGSVVEDSSREGLVELTRDGKPLGIYFPKFTPSNAKSTEDGNLEEARTYYESYLSKLHGATPAASELPSIAPLPEMKTEGTPPVEPTGGAGTPGGGGQEALPPIPAAMGAHTKEDHVELNIRYVKGPSFERSYFIAKQGNKAKIVHASRVIPEDVQKLVKEGKETEVASPEEIVGQMYKISGGTLEGFVKWAETLPKLSPEALERAAAEMSVVEKEISEPEMPKKGDGAFMSVNAQEAAAGQKLVPEAGPAAKGSDVPGYYKRLPGAGKTEVAGQPHYALNPQSKILQRKYELIKEALAEAEDKAAKAEEKAQGLEKQVEEMGAAQGQEEDMKLREQILAEVKRMGKCPSPECEKEILDHLAKIDKKSLPHVLGLMKSMGKKPGMKEGMPELMEGPKEAEPMGGEMPPMGGAGLPPLASSMGGENLPPLFHTEAMSEPETLVSKMVRMWRH